MEADLKEVSVITVGVVLALLIVAVLVYLPLRDNADLQRHYNTTLVKCVEAGSDPLQCKAALTENQ